jgi:hypothetical protein
MGLPRSGGGRRPATCRARFERRPAPEGPQRSGGAGAAGLRGDVARPEGSAAHPREREKAHHQRRRAISAASAERQSIVTLWPRPARGSAEIAATAAVGVERARAHRRPSRSTRAARQKHPCDAPAGAAACARSCAAAAAAPSGKCKCAHAAQKQRAAPAARAAAQCPLLKPRSTREAGGARGARPILPTKPAPNRKTQIHRHFPLFGWRANGNDGVYRG